MEIKILCACGVKFKFDVEPVNQRMPVSIQCPGCGVDATEAANAQIAQALGSPIPVQAQAVPLVVMAPPPEPAAVAAKPRLRVAGHAAAVPLSAPAEAVETPPPAPPAPPIRVPLAAAGTPAKAKGTPSFGLGLVGALAGVLVGVGLWLVVNQFIGAKSKFLILGVGFFAGLGARLLSRDEGSQQLGMIAAALTLVGVFGMQYHLAYQEMFGGDFSELVEEDFKTDLEDAKKVLAQMPNETDDEIRLYLLSALAEEAEEEGEKFDTNLITADDIRAFREEDLPRYKGLVTGAIVMDAYQKEADKNIEEVKQSAGMKLWLIVQGFGMFKLGLLIGSCGLAYRMSANA